MQLNWRSHWLWLVVLLTALSTADYIDHVTRPGEAFGDQPMAWFGFTAASHITVLAAAFGIAMTLRRLPLSSLAADTFGVAGAVGLHLAVTGPFWNGIFWPHGTMTFDNPYLPMAAAMVAYLLYRALFWLACAGLDRLRR